MNFRCTQCQKRCRKVGESATLFGDPPQPDHVCYKCETHGYHVVDVEHDAVYGESGRPAWDLDYIQSNMNIEWKWLEP